MCTAETVCGGTYGSERKRKICVQICCGRWGETKKIEVADVSDAVSGVRIVSRPVAYE